MVVKERALLIWKKEKRGKVFVEGEAVERSHRLKSLILGEKKKCFCRRADLHEREGGPDWTEGAGKRRAVVFGEKRREKKN